MMLEVLKSKIHNARVTGTNLEYIGSITIDKALMKAANFNKYEKVLVSNLRNGERFSTYVMEGKENSGIIEINGAAARLARKGDRIIVMGFALLNEKEIKKHSPKIVRVDKKNKIVKFSLGHI